MQNQAQRQGNALVYRKNKSLIERIVSLPGLLVKYVFMKFVSENAKIDEFINNNQNLLIIIGNPDTDKLIMSYNGRIVINQIKMANGRKAHVVREVLRQSQFKNHIDMFLSAIAESMVLPISKAQDFYQWIDGAIYRIGRSLKKSK